MNGLFIIKAYFTIVPAVDELMYKISRQDYEG